jgi:hypothetical protein
MTRRLGGVLGTLAVVLLQASAFAKPSGPPVRLSTAACDDLPWDKIRHLIEIELGASLVESARAPDPNTTQVMVDCTGAATRLRVDEPVTGKALERRLALDKTPERARPRLVALAITELVFASWMELSAEPKEEVPTVGATASAETREQVLAAVRGRMQRQARQWRLSALGASRTIRGEQFSFGGGLLLQLALPGWASFTADVVGDRGRVDLTGGQANIDTLSVGLGAYWGREFAPTRLDLGIGGRVAMTAIKGQPDPGGSLRGETLAAPWGGPFASARFGVAMGRAWGSLGVEGGWVVLPITGRVAGRPEVQIDRFWVTLALGLGWEL